MYYIWFRRFRRGRQYGGGVYPTGYKFRSSAYRTAHKLFDNEAEVEWVVSKTNPFN